MHAMHGAPFHFHALWNRTVFFLPLASSGGDCVVFITPPQITAPLDTVVDGIRFTRSDGTRFNGLARTPAIIIISLLNVYGS